MRRVGKYIQNLLEKFLPRKTKKTFCLGSIFPYILGTDKLSSTTINKLNTVFNLTKDQDVINFPIMISKYIWTDLKQEELTSFADKNNDGEVDELVHQIVDNVPSWITYGSKTEIEKDIRLMLSTFSDKKR